jgi:hypothetical protein
VSLATRYSGCCRMAVVAVLRLSKIVISSGMSWGRLGGPRAVPRLAGLAVITAKGPAARATMGRSPLPGSRMRSLGLRAGVVW